MVQEKLEHRNPFCVFRPVTGKPRRKSLVHAPDYFYRNNEFQRGKESRNRSHSQRHQHDYGKLHRGRPVR